MSIETGLSLHLRNTPGITNLVSDRVYGQTLPDNPTIPALTYQRVEAEHDLTLSGPSQLARTRFKVDCHTASYEDAGVLRDLVREALLGFKGMMGTTNVHGVLYENDKDFFEKDTERHRSSIDFTVWHEERRP